MHEKQLEFIKQALMGIIIQVLNKQLLPEEAAERFKNFLRLQYQVMKCLNPRYEPPQFDESIVTAEKFIAASQLLGSAQLLNPGVVLEDLDIRGAELMVALRKLSEAINPPPAAAPRSRVDLWCGGGSSSSVGVPPPPHSSPASASSRSAGAGAAPAPGSRG